MAFLGLIPIVFGLAFALVPLLYYAYHKVRAQGYRAPSAVVTVIVSWIAITTLIYESAPNSIWNGLDNLSVYIFILYLFWFPALASTAFVLLVARLLPKKDPRRFGARRVRIPFLRMGQVIVGLAVLMAVFFLLVLIPSPRDYSGSFTGLVIAGFVFFVGAYLMHVGRRADLSTTTKPLKRKTDIPVGTLYLRSFRQESQPFAIGPQEKLRTFAPSWVASMADNYGAVHLTFEQYFETLLAQTIGPFVALGSPEDYVAPEGAMRVYAKDSEWTEWLHDLAMRAVCILVEFGRSENLHWEFEHLRREGLQKKLFVLTQPSHDDARFAWAFRNTLARLKGLRPVRWSEFSRNLAKLGYELNFEDPGPGSVIGFDENGHGVVLTTNAEAPPDFVAPVCAWLGRPGFGTLPKAIRCLSCGRDFHAPRSSDGRVRARFCRLCDQGLKQTERLWEQFSWIFWATLGASLSLLVILAPAGSWIKRHPSSTPLGGLSVAIAIGMLIERIYQGKIAMRVGDKYRKLAQQGDALAMFHLAQFYTGARPGVRADDSQVVYWCRKAAESGDPEAMYSLGVLFHNGEKGVPRDPVQALSWYRKAADAGETCAMNNLGKMYEDGEALPHDESQAIKWYEAAAKLNLPIAKKNLERLRKVEGVTS